MLFSDFIRDSLLGKNDISWNYYCADIDVENILRADISSRFIRQYFINGEKELPLILNPEEAAIFLKNYFIAGRKERLLSFEIDRQYLLPDNRAIHTVSGFFLGLLIENCLNAGNSLSIEFPQHFPFSYLWFLTFLYHDYGYCVAERDDAPIALPERASIPDNYYPWHTSKIRYEEYRVLSQAKAELGINISPFSGSYNKALHLRNRENISLESALLRELTQRSCTIAGHSKLKFNTGTEIYGYQYTSTIVTRYFNYCINERKRLDHGIIGGYLFYDRMIKNYLCAYLSVLQESLYPVSLGNFYYRGRHFSESQLPVFSYIADCILAHNIWKQSEETRDLYGRYRLNVALGEAYKTITFSDNPLLYLLVVADTLEPMKTYATITPETVSEAISIEYLSGTHILTFSSGNTAVDIGILYQKAKGLEEWTSVRCSELYEGKFTLYL